MKPRYVLAVAIIFVLLLAVYFYNNKILAVSPQLAKDTASVSLDGTFLHFADDTGKVLFDSVSQELFIQKHFTPLRSSRSLGYNTDAHWFYTNPHPHADAPRRWVLSIGSPELENVDVWVGNPQRGFAHYVLGYHQPYENRPLRTRQFSMPIDIDQNTQIFLRVYTTNALNVHATLWQVNAFTAHETRDNFYRGGYFGILLIVVVFYFIFGLRAADSVLLAYAGYITAQLLFHLGTNGYLPVLLGGNSAWATDALPRVGWLGGAACIALMWDKLLALKNTLPRLHIFYLWNIGFSLSFLPFALMPFLVGEWLLYFVKLENLLNIFIFFISMALLWRYWMRDKRTELLVYFVAFAIPALATAVNTSLNQGWLAWNVVTAEFYQVATLVHVLVMSYGLALRLRQMQIDKQTAEQEVVLAARRAEEQRRFVAMLSHEFGNPLAAIDRSAQMIQIKASELPAQEMQRLQQIRKNATQLSGLVSHFLTTEALDNHAVSLTRKMCSLHSLMEQVMQQLDDARERIQVNVTPQNAKFLLDASLFSAALSNLVVNALRYSPPTSSVSVAVECSASGLRVTVSDSGSGLAQEELSELGKPYFRAASSQGKTGSGLGYYFARRIVEAHGGTLTARSSKCGGLEVEILLPKSALE